MTRVKTRRSQVILVIATLAALHTVLSFMPGVWRRWSIVLLPIEGMMAGPAAGFAAALLGALVGRMFRPDAVFLENFFGVGEAFGALSAGLMLKGRWKFVMLAYAGLLASFILSPNSRNIPLWTLWNIYLALLLVLPSSIAIAASRRGNGGSRYLILSAALISFVAVEMDVLVRVVMLVPLGLFALYPIPIDLLPEIFVLGAFTTPVEALYAVIVNVVAGVPTLLILRRNRILEWPLT